MKKSLIILLGIIFAFVGIELLLQLNYIIALKANELFGTNEALVTNKFEYKIRTIDCFIRLNKYIEEKAVAIAEYK